MSRNGIAWTAIPEVQIRMNVRSSGKSDVGWHAYCLSLLRRDLLGHARMLVVGRESEWLEGDLLRRNVFERCDIVGNRLRSRAAPLTGGGPESRPARIRYLDADLNATSLSPSTYDAIWCDVALCRVAGLERLVTQIAQSLRPDGLLFAYEYVGADRFAIGSAQRAAAQAAFSLIPRRYRYARETPEKILVEVPLPAPGGVPDDDSVPISSSRVLPVLRDQLEIIQSHPVGGTLLQFVLRDIAANFRLEDRVALAVLEMLFAIEDALIDSGELESDFMLIIAKAKMTA